MRKILIILMLVIPVYAWSQDAVFPALTGPVVDTTSTLTAEQVKKLSAKSLSLQKENGAQVVVCVIDTTSPLPIEDYGIRLAERWKVGRAKIDDGVIIIVAMKDRKMRIEVGYGLEPVITDLKAGRIIDMMMAPHFKKGEFYDGINSAFDAVETLVKGVEPAEFVKLDEQLAAYEKERSLSEAGSNAGLGVIIAGFILFIVFVAMGRPLLSLAVSFFSLWGGIYLVNGGSAGESAVIAGIAAFICGLVGFGLKYGSGTSGSSSGYSSSSSYSSSSYSGSSSSSYSGGGGSFGGGGASGSW